MRAIRFGRKTVIGIAALAVIGLVTVATAPGASARPRHAADSTIYDSTVQPSPGNLASESFEATATAEFGNQISFGGTARVLDSVVVTLSSWGCEQGSWSTPTGSATPNPCLTPDAGATFNEPITLNLYNVGPASAHGPSTVGSLIASDTQTFAIPFRPSEDDVNCTSGGNPDGAWFDAGLGQCFHGMVTNVQFNFGHVTVPGNVIYGVAYNTSDWGAQPYGDATACHNATDSYVSPNTYDDCGYDSLNVALSAEPTAPSVGSDPYQGTVYENVVNASYATNDYCDGGAAGINVFRIDEPANYPTGNGTTANCWAVNNPSLGPPWYVPAVQFTALQSPHAIITSANHASAVAGTPFSFTVTTAGVPTPTISCKGKLPKGLTFKDNGDGTGTLSGTALTADRNKVYTLILRAVNLSTGGRNRQQFSLTLTGGKGRK